MEPSGALTRKMMHCSKRVMTISRNATDGKDAGFWDFTLKSSVMFKLQTGPVCVSA